MSQDLNTYGNVLPFVGPGELIEAGKFTGLVYLYPKTLKAGMYQIMTFPNRLDSTTSGAQVVCPKDNYGRVSLPSSNFQNLPIFLHKDESNLEIRTWWGTISRSNYSASSGDAGNLIHDGTNFMFLRNVTGGAKVFVSTDFLTWTSRSIGANTYTAPTQNASNNVCLTYVSGQTNKYIVTLSTTASTNNLYYSTDAITWTGVSITITGQTGIQGIIYNGNVTEKYIGYDAGSTNAAKVVTSTDGATWNVRTAFTQTIYGMATSGSNSGEVYAAALNNATNQVITSTDGITWTSRTTGFAQASASIFYFNGIYILFHGANQPYFTTSTDGITWVIRNLTQGIVRPGTNTFGRINDNKLFTKANPFSTTNIYSTDGITWERYESSASAVNGPDLLVNGRYYTVVGTDSDLIVNASANYVAIYKLNNQVTEI